MNSVKLWWVTPQGIVVGFIMPLYVLCTIALLSIENSFYLHGNVYLDITMFLVGFLIIASYCTGVIFGRCFKAPRLSRDKEHRVYYLDISFLLAFVAYLIWFLPFANNSSLLIKLVSGDATAVWLIREVIGTVPGVTTFTQVGILYSALFSYFYICKQAMLKKRHFVFFMLLLLCVFFRSFAWSERLAMIEYIVPIGLAIVLKYQEKFRNNVIISLAPYFGFILVFFMFAVFEYFRSWSAFYINIYDSYWDFVIERFFSYYYIAINNGAGLAVEQGVFNAPIYSFSWLFEFPFIGEWLSSSFGFAETTAPYLERYANPELNNMSAIFTSYYEFGLLAIVAWFLFGLVSGWLWNRYKNFEFWGWVIYPIVFLSALEMLRIHFFLSVRTVPFWLVVLLLIFFESTTKRSVRG